MTSTRIVPPRESRQRSSANGAQPKYALYAFVVVEVVALVLFLVHGRTQWFFYDEWDYLVDRSATDLDDLFRAHSQHWSTLPILEYRALFTLFGLRTYLPYQVPVVVLHLVVAALVRAIMRRADVDPWIATGAASLFALFGAASENIVWAFQFAWQLTLVLGLVHLVCADHDGPLGCRDVIGLAAGAVALLCSGVAVTTTFVVGLAVLLRRGWRPAAFHTVPLGLVYLVWWLILGRDAYTTPVEDVGDTLDFATRGYAAMFDALGQVPFFGWVLAALLVAGLVYAWRDSSLPDLRRRAAAPVAMLCGAVVFYVLSALGRASLFESQYNAGRYLHVAGALTLPALALAVDALARRRPALIAVGTLLFLVGVPGNIDALATRDEGPGGYVLGQKELILTLAHVPAVTEVPRSVRPVRGEPEPVTAGWLVDNVEAGRIPRPSPTRRAIVDTATLRLSLEVIDEQPAPARCDVLAAEVERHFVSGDVLVVERGAMTAMLGEGQRTYTAAPRRVVLVARRPVDVRLRPADPSAPPVVCT
jgi:hypothetical protein